MARLKMPFVDPVAVKGTLGKSVVFSTWKGIPYARKWAQPANPRTSEQVANRSQFTEAVALWHDTRLTATDKKAWNLRAQIGAKIQSGYNNFIALIRKIPLTDDIVLVYNLKMEASGANVKPKITCTGTGTMDLIIVRGPHAGYSQSLAVVPGVEKTFADILINSNDICVFSFSAVGSDGVSGFFRAVVGGF